MTRTYCHYSPVELEYLRAANSLPCPQRSAALSDIAAMCDRDRYGIRVKANKMRKIDRAALQPTVRLNLNMPVGSSRRQSA